MRQATSTGHGPVRLRDAHNVLVFILPGMDTLTRPSAPNGGSRVLNAASGCHAARLR
jgi:hypothetical protein